MSSKRTYRIIGLMAIIQIVKHLWIFWQHDKDVISPFPLLKDYSLNVYWYVYFLSDCIAYLLVSAILLLASRMNQTLKVASVIFSSICVIDLVLFLLLCNVINYTIVFLFVILLICVVCYYEFGTHEPRVHYKRDEPVKNKPIFSIKKYHRKEHSQT